MATYGEGDPTDNAQELYEHLQQGENADVLYYVLCTFLWTIKTGYRVDVEV